MKFSEDLEVRCARLEEERDLWYSRCAAAVYLLPKHVLTAEVQEAYKIITEETAALRARIQELEESLIASFLTINDDMDLLPAPNILEDEDSPVESGNHGYHHTHELSCDEELQYDWAYQNWLHNHQV